MKKTLMGLFVLLGILLAPGATHAALSTNGCQLESDYLKKQQELTELSPCVKPGQECVRQLTKPLMNELELCRAQVDAYSKNNCALQAPAHGKSSLGTTGTCKITCQKGYYLTKSSQCKATLTTLKDQPKEEKKINSLLKQIAKLTKQLEKLQAER